PRTDQILGHGQGAQLVGGEAGLIKIHGTGGGMKEPNVELVTKGAGHRSVNELSTSHGRAIRKRHDDFLAATAGDFCEIVETNSNHGAVLGADEAVAVSFDEVPEG